MKAFLAFLIGSLHSPAAISLAAGDAYGLPASSSIESTIIASNSKSKRIKFKALGKSSLVNIPNPNLLNLSGPNVSLIFKRAQAKKAFEYLISQGKYGFVWVQADPTFNNQPTTGNIIDVNNSLGTNSAIGSTQSLYSNAPANQMDSGSSSQTSGTADSQRLITLNLKNISYNEAFNALIIASGLQAKLLDNIIYVGPNVRNTVFAQRQTKIYQLNQVSANSAADYLANLGASVTKTYTIKTSVTAGATQSETVQGSNSTSTTTEQAQTSVTIYGSTVGPLLGLLATTDDRLQKVTLIGDINMISIAENYLEQLDQRNLQVALTVQILDINASNTDSLSNSFAKLIGDTFIVNDAGKLLTYFGSKIPPTEENISSVPIPNPGTPFRPQEFINVLSSRIVSSDTKVLASPTLMLSEFSGDTGGESVSFSSIGSALNTGSIGRAKGNEAFVMVGNQVAINASREEGATTCTYDYGLEGLTFGARILGIDDNGYVTFTVSPAISGISETRNISSCGEISLLTTRRLDTGNIRVKDGNTLILTGVLDEGKTIRRSRIPIFGSIPLLGSVFGSSGRINEKRELVILVTPRIVKDINDKIEGYGYQPNSKDAKKILQEK